jgi:hypothetical protein
LRATLNDRLVAEGDDVEVGAGYKYFPASATRLDLLRKVTQDRGRPRPPHTPNVPKREWPNPGPHNVTAVDDECGGSYRCGILGFPTR